MHIYAFIFGQNQQARPVLKNTRTTTPYLQKYVQNNKNPLLRTCRCAMAQKVTKRQFTRALVPNQQMTMKQCTTVKFLW